MLDAGERAYAYSKACAIIGKSFVGKRISALSDLRSVNELDRLIFPELQRELPGRELLSDLENRIINRSVNQILSVVKSFSKAPELLIRQLRSYEYSDLKTCLHYIQAGKKKLPSLAGIGEYGTVKFSFFPDLRLMLQGTEYDFILKRIPENFEREDFDLSELEAEMDLHYYTALKISLYDLFSDDRIIAQRILAEEISLRNCVWALRLRTYFKKSVDETKKHLMNITVPSHMEEIHGSVKVNANTVSHTKQISLAHDAEDSLGRHLDMKDDWQAWRWKKFLNPETPGELWTADPRYFQNAASFYLYNLALHNFHKMPFAVSAIFCFIKLKQFEEDILISILEGLGLGMHCADVFELLEVPL